MSLPFRFADALTAFAADVGNSDVGDVAARLGAPVTVAVRGRPGVGVGAVAAALSASGVSIVAGERADARIVVVAEAVKPEDRLLLAGARPALIVLNKADLCGATPGGPLAEAERVAAGITRDEGVPVVPMIAHLATVALDSGDPDVAALRALVSAPPDVTDMTSVDAFVESGHPVPAEARRRLLTRLDRFGLAHAVVAFADGAAPAQVSRSLRALSQVERVRERLDAMEAEIRYRRVCAAQVELRMLAARDDRVASFLAGDDAVIAVMAAAVDVMTAAGLRVDPADDPAAHRYRALRWRHYADGPLDALHRRCAADISRGSLRLLALSR